MASDAAAAVRVRRIGPDDWQAFRDLRLRALAAEPWAFGSTLAREQAFTEAHWKQRIFRDSPDAPAMTWVAERRGSPPLGMVASARMDGTFHIFAMWVAPERRREGIAGRLLDEALRWVEGIAPGSSIRLEVNPRAVAAVRLYESRGFRATGTSRPLDHAPTERVVEMIRPG